ncbi:MAG: nuclear transport factor 2 family protein [Herpetosiphonaceae bacterium]|nr:nuclear transport factor 2 family protein [Herpetosiphonaceae bacterium]
MSSEESRYVVEQFWAAMNANDFRAAGDLLHDEFMLEWPQSGERIRGRENFVSINEHYPATGRWQITLMRIVADPGGVATEVMVTDGVRSDRAITFSTVRDSKIVHQTEYWPDRFEASPWRVQWVEHG